jgi:hypothetical protein
MGYVKEPEGITLTVVNKGLNEAEKKAISDFIQKSKATKQQKTKAQVKPKATKKSASKV